MNSGVDSGVNSGVDDRDVVNRTGADGAADLSTATTGRGSLVHQVRGRIVVAVEDLVSAGPALSWAADGARRRDTSVRLVGIVAREPAADPFTADYLDDHFGERVAGAHRVLGAARRVVLREAAGTDVSTAVTEGTVADVLVGVSGQADVLVLGAPRRNVHLAAGAGRSRRDSTAVHVAGASGCPLVVARTPVRRNGPVVLGHDGSALADLALDFAAGEARSRGVDLVLVRVRERGFRPDGEPPALDDALARTRRRHPRTAVLGREVEHPYVGDGLLEATAGAQLLVVGSGGEHGYRTSPLGSTTRSLLHRAEVALAVVPCWEGPPSVT